MNGPVHKAAPVEADRCQHCGKPIRSVPGGHGLAWVHADTGAVAGLTPVPIGYVKHNGAGEIVFRQAGHPANEEAIEAAAPGVWNPVFLEPPGPMDRLTREALRLLVEAEQVVDARLEDLIAEGAVVARGGKVRDLMVRMTFDRMVGNDAPVRALLWGLTRS